MCYGNLKIEMMKRNITIESIAKLLDVHRNSAANKVNGKSHFTIEEAEKIHNVLFPDLEITYLFRRTDL